MNLNPLAAKCRRQISDSSSSTFVEITSTDEVMHSIVAIRDPVRRTTSSYALTSIYYFSY